MTERMTEASLAEIEARANPATGRGDERNGCDGRLEMSEPHEVGTARCGVCGREWTAIAPAERAPIGLECPSCGHMAGDFKEGEE